MINFRDKSKTEAKFEPVAVVQHSGTMTGDGEGQGHYICDVKCKKFKCWYRLNDNMDPVLISANNVTKKSIVILYKRK